MKTMTAINAGPSDYRTAGEIYGRNEADRALLFVFQKVRAGCDDHLTMGSVIATVLKDVVSEATDHMRQNGATETNLTVWTEAFCKAVAEGVSPFAPQPISAEMLLQAMPQQQTLA